jgi:hypothetical protein
MFWRLNAPLYKATHAHEMQRLAPKPGASAVCELARDGFLRVSINAPKSCEGYVSTTACEAGTRSRPRHTQAFALASVLHTNAAGCSGRAPGFSVRASLLRSAILDLRDFPVYVVDLRLDFARDSSQAPLLIALRGPNKVRRVLKVVRGGAQIPAKLT